MPNKYPGGYQIIDLGGVELSDTVVIVSGIYDRILASKKPVLLTNFSIKNGVANSYYPPQWGALITSMYDDRSSYFAPIMSTLSEAEYIEVDAESQVSIKHREP